MRFCAEKLQLGSIEIRVSRVAICDSFFEFSTPVTNFATPINFWDYYFASPFASRISKFASCMQFSRKWIWNHVRVEKGNKVAFYDGQVLCLDGQLEETHCNGRAIESFKSVQVIWEPLKEWKERRRERNCSYFLLGNAAMARGILCNRRNGLSTGII